RRPYFSNQAPGAPVSLFPPLPEGGDGAPGGARGLRDPFPELARPRFRAPDRRVCEARRRGARAQIRQVCEACRQDAAPPGAPPPTGLFALWPERANAASPASPPRRPALERARARPRLGRGGGFLW